MSDPKPINTDLAPAAIGPYSQAVRFGDVVFCSGQIPLDPQSMEIVEGGIEAQTKQVFENLKAVATEADTSLDRAIKLTIFLTDLGDFAVVNEIMAQNFSEPYPARATIEVSALPKGAIVEIEAVLAG